MDYIYYIIGLTLLVILVLYLCLTKKINVFIVALTSKRRIQKNLYEHCKTNDFLIINDLYYPMNNMKYKYIDTIIIANKFIYIIKEFKTIGEINFKADDESWRVIYDKRLSLMDNPILKNRAIINNLANSIEGLSIFDFKNIVVFTSTCSLKGKTLNDNEYVLLEGDVFKTILDIEKKSNKEPFNSIRQEQIIKEIYDEGIKAEKRISEARNK